MICPSDFLEPVINKRLKGQKYFYTSLGNTITLDKDTLGQIAAIIEKNGIKEITFVLSEDNSFLHDALNNQNYIETRGLNEAYSQLLDYKKIALNSWGIHNQRTIILSYYLNEKIRILKSELHLLLPNLPEINGKSFSKSTNNFSQIYADLACINSNILN